MADVLTIEPIAELATVVAAEPLVTKETMYDDLTTLFGDFIKVIAMRKAGQDPFPAVEVPVEGDAAAKKKKDKKNRPPRAPSAYNIFMKSVQDQVKSEYPDLKQTELMKHIAARWNESDEKKISDQKRQEAQDLIKKEKKKKKAGGDVKEKEEEDVKKEEKKKEKKGKKRDADGETPGKKAGKKKKASE